MDEFFSRVNDLNRIVEQLGADVKEVNRLHDTVLWSSDKQDASTARKQRDRLMDSIKSRANTLNKQLKQLENENEKEAARGAARTAHRSESRIRRNQFACVAYRFRDVMSEYNDCQVRFRAKSKAKLQRQLEITGKPTSPAELEDLLENGEARVFTQGIVAQTDNARQMLQDIEERHEDIVKLERSIKELHGIFLDVALLVENQGETLDIIDKNVEETTVSVVNVTKQLDEAKKLKAKARRMKIIIGLLIAAILLFIVLVIYMSW